jgi:membrane-bound lytic murein transglycosylase D
MGLFTSTIKYMKKLKPIFILIALVLLSNISLSQTIESRAFRLPDFSHQEGALGYDANSFKTPKELEPIVNFWVNVYTQYPSDHGFIHDTDNLKVVYSVVDFSPVVNDNLLTDIQKEKAKDKIIENEKKRISEILLKFANHPPTEAETLNPEDQKIWSFFKNETDFKEIKAAAKIGRIRFQLGLKDRMEEAIRLSGRYLEEFENIFKEQGLPLELTRLAFVESSFNVFARSKVGASGLWQIMKSTGKGKIKINSSIDLRNDPIESTRLAAKVLKYNYNLLESWPLAVTGYNHGPAGVRRISERNKTKDLSILINSNKVSNTFAFASRNFYCSFLAALKVESAATTYFPAIAWANPLSKRSLILPKNLKYSQLMGWFSNDDKTTQLYNPHINTIVRKGSADIPKGTIIYIPKDSYELALDQLINGVKNQNREPSSSKKPTTANKITPQSKSYRVRRGDTLLSIARKYGIELSTLIAKNSLRHKDDIQAGQLLKLAR